MKVAIILDYDGHVDCVEWNADNAARIIEVAVESDHASMGIFDPDTEDEVDAAWVEGFLAQPRDADWLKQAARFVNQNFGDRSNGNMINVLDPEPAVSRERIRYWLS